jgi:hypothetical protein
MVAEGAAQVNARGKKEEEKPKPEPNVDRFSAHG